MEGHKKNEFNLDNGKKGKRKKVPMKNYCEKKKTKYLKYIQTYQL